MDNQRRGGTTILISTRPEITHTRNNELFFSNWIRENLPEGNTGFAVSNIDYVIYDYTLQTVMLVELKTHDAKLHKWQRKFLAKMDKWLRKGIADDPQWQYLGTHLITFMKTNFKDGDVYLDKKLSNEQEIKTFLSGENHDNMERHNNRTFTAQI